MKNKILILFMLIFFLVPKNSYALDKIDVKTNVLNIDQSQTRYLVRNETTETNKDYIDSDKSYDQNCNTYINEDMKEFLQSVFTVLKIAAPVLVLIFSFKEFLPAIMSGKQDDIKKAGKNLTIRLIAALLLFIIPTIINILLDLIGNSSGNCGIK